MFGVAFRREPKSTYQDQWSFVFSNFGVKNIWEQGFAPDDGKIYQTTIPFDTYEDLPDLPLVVFAPPAGKYIQGKIPLPGFDHPDNAVYCFGGSHANLTEDDFGGREPDHLVYIPTVAHELYAFSAAYIALYDRYVKRGDFG